MRGGNKKKSRISGIDLVRFACAIGILLHHAFFFFWQDEKEFGTEPRFRVGFIIVEIFLIIAGYFAAQHFKKRRARKIDSLEIRAKEAVKYTLKKFKGFFPYIVIALFLGVIYSLISHEFSIAHLIYQFEKLPQELLFNSGNVDYFTRHTHLAPLWYLSLLFFVFPIFCTLAMSKKKYIRNWLYFVFLSVYYSIFFDGQYIGFEGMIRIFAGLAAGQLLFDFVEFIKKKKIKTMTRVLLQFAELFFIYYIIDKLLNRGDIIRPVTANPYMFNFMLFSWLGLALMLGEKTYSYKINSRFISFLGQVSFPLYLFHLPIMMIIHTTFGKNLGFKYELLISATISIIFSIIIFLIISKRKSHSK